MKYLASLALMAGLTAAFTNSVHAQTAAARADGNWNSDIWSPTNTGAISPGLRPVNGDAVRFATNGVDVILDSVLTGTFTTVQLQNPGALATLTLNSGALINTTGLNNAANGGTSSVTINAGARWNVGSNGVRVVNSAGATGTISVNGGDLISSGIFIVGGASAMTGTLNFSGGTIQATTLQKAAGSTVTFNWTGGNLIVPETNLPTINNAGTGNLVVGGISTVGTFVLQAAATTTYTQGENASLTLDFVSAASFDTIGIGAGTALNINLDGTIILNLVAGFTPTAGQTYDVITATSIVDNGFVLGGNGASWFTAEVLDFGGTDVLRLTAVPEPSVIGLALLGVVGLVGMKLRRKT